MPTVPATSFYFLNTYRTSQYPKASVLGDHRDDRYGIYSGTPVKEKTLCLSSPKFNFPFNSYMSTACVDFLFILGVFSSANRITENV